MDTQTMADAIYSECYGHLDDRRFRQSKTQEIVDWLNDGEALTPTDTPQALARDWADYAAEDPNIQYPL